MLARVRRRLGGTERATRGARLSTPGGPPRLARLLPARHADELYAELDDGLRGALSDRRLLTIFSQFNDPLRFQPRWKTLFPTAHQVTVRRGNHFPMCHDPDLVASAVKAQVGAG